MGYYGWLRRPGGRHPLSGTGGNNEQGRGGIGRLWPIFVGLPLIALLAIGAIVLSGGGGEEPSTATGGQRQAQNETGDDDGTAELGTPTLGSASAPVVLTEYSDFQ